MRRSTKPIAVEKLRHEDAPRKNIPTAELVPWPGDRVCAEGRYAEGAGDDGAAGAERRAAVFVGPEFGTVTGPDLVEAAREAADAGFDVLVACAFNFEAHTTEFSKLGRIPVLKARMNADLHMADELKNSGIRGHQRRICRQRRLPGSVQYRRGSGRDRHLTDLRTGREM